MTFGQKTESFLYRWLHANASVDVMFFVGASHVISSVMLIRLYK